MVYQWKIYEIYEKNIQMNVSDDKCDTFAGGFLIFFLLGWIWWVGLCMNWLAELQKFARGGHLRMVEAHENHMRIELNVCK